MGVGVCHTIRTYDNGGYDKEEIPKLPEDSYNDGSPKWYVHQKAFMKVLGSTIDINDSDFTPIFYDRMGATPKLFVWCEAKIIGRGRGRGNHHHDAEVFNNEQSSSAPIVDSRKGIVTEQDEGAGSNAEASDGGKIIMKNKQH